MSKRVLAKDTSGLVGQEVMLMGWANSRRDHGGVIFIDLRDESGLVQVTIHPDSAEAFKSAEGVRDEYVLKVSGKVIEREASLVNPNLETGKVEVVVGSLEVLNKAEPLPFSVRNEDENVGEDVRLKYRYLDLRRSGMSNMLVRRHQMLKFIRDWMDEKEFIEINTPILANSSPEGARDYLVPSRLHPGKFFALPQAPQQFKQLLMVGGIPRYYQIAPCFRDEDARADRSPGEFYQLDLEIAFAETDEVVFELMEPLFVELTENFTGKKVLQKPFPRIPYAEAMDKYGNDKPDLRFGMEMVNLSEELKNTEFGVFGGALKNSGVVKAICVEKGASLTRSEIDKFTEIAKQNGAGGLAYINFKEGGVQSPIAKFLNEAELEAIKSKLGVKDGDAVFFGADSIGVVNKVLGVLRNEFAEHFELKDPNIVAWAWIVDFPMYEYDEKFQKIDFMHNPFSWPQGGLEALNTQDPLEVKAYQYDIVANGFELSSGAIRNYNPEIMYRAFEIVGYSKEHVDKKFGAMINAFKFGAPPHGGFAPGIERMLMVLEGKDNIREVVAFPKNGSGMDLMMNSPSAVDEAQLDELGIKLS